MRKLLQVRNALKRVGPGCRELGKHAPGFFLNQPLEAEGCLSKGWAARLCLDKQVTFLLVYICMSALDVPSLRANMTNQWVVQ